MQDIAPLPTTALCFDIERLPIEGPGGKVLRVVKFPANRNFYLFLSEIDEVAKPRVYSIEYIKATQEEYERGPDKDDDDE